MGNFCQRRARYPVPSLKPNQVHSSSFSPQYSQWIPVKPVPLPSLPTQISFMTYNIWFEEFEFEERTNRIIEMILERSPSFLCLQEVTGPFLSKILKNKQFQSSYYLSTNSIRGYGIVICSKFPIECYEYKLPTTMGRSVLVSTVSVQDTEIRIAVATVHLESGTNRDIRKKQLLEIFGKLEEFDVALLLGDFNFDNPEENTNIPKEYIDFWPELNNFDKEGGYTMLGSKRLGPWRPDRVLMKRNKWLEPREVKVIGREPIAKFKEFKPEDVRGFTVTPSDHYGIIAEIGLAK